MTQVQIRLPDTLAGWPWPRVPSNPYLDEVKPQSEKWVRSLNVFGPESQDTMERADFCLLAAMCYPHLDKERFGMACDYMMLLFTIDEFMDRCPGNQARANAATIVNALENPYISRPAGEFPLGEIVRQFSERAMQTVTPIARERLIDSFRLYTDAMATECIDRDTLAIRSIEEFLRLRPYTAGVEPALVPLQFGINLPDEVFSHPVVVKLSKLVADAIWLDNDLASYNKEQATGEDFHNIITVVMAELQVDVRGAYAWLEAKRVQVAADIIATWATLPVWREDIREDATTYLRGVVGWVRANAEWNFASQRYFGEHGKEIEEHRTVTLLPKRTGKGVRANGAPALSDLTK
ncbi:terpenoid synthase [Artomyces pyxidatus]|uniref:Terpenoid synthase n=1 Tax=Artomyces pyxidatus TaxID=48021 RepID=A0ACB8SI81_9AGAM|nr:terpenoid synthase [Artomyces pyxidatus]